jgi:hypothetical protein
VRAGFIALSELPAWVQSEVDPLVAGLAGKLLALEGMLDGALCMRLAEIASLLVS